MSDVLDAVRQLGGALLDAWYVVDEDDRILEFNGAFRELFPRGVARNLKSLTCAEVIKHPGCGGEKCLRRTAAEHGALRLDELEAEIGGTKLRFIVGAAPIPLPDGRRGALILLRNVTDEARVQERYQKLEETARTQQGQLEHKLEERTRDLLIANELINRLERELARYKRGEA